MSHSQTVRHDSLYEYGIALTFVNLGQNSWLKCPLGFLAVIYCTACLYCTIPWFAGASICIPAQCGLAALENCPKKTTKPFGGEPKLYKFNTNRKVLYRQKHVLLTQKDIHCISVLMDPPLALGDASMMK